MSDKPNPPICTNCKHFNGNDAKCHNHATAIFSPVFGLMPLKASDVRGVEDYAKCGPDGILWELTPKVARHIQTFSEWWLSKL
jgi:hypothetical protein